VFKVNKYKNQMPGGVVPKTKMEANTKVNQKAVTLYQINGKGAKVAKVGGIGTEVEATIFALSKVLKAAKMDKKSGLKYLRTLNISKGQEIYFPTMERNTLKGLKVVSGKAVRLGQFLDYSPELLADIITELTA
jgi:hypothetical protein